MSQTSNVNIFLVLPFHITKRFSLVMSEWFERFDPDAANRHMGLSRVLHSV